MREIKTVTVRPKTPIRPRRVDIPQRPPVTIAEKIVAIKQQIAFLRKSRPWDIN